MNFSVKDDRAQALRALLVELPTDSRDIPRAAPQPVRRVLLGTAALGLAATATVLAVQTMPWSGPGPSASEGPAAAPSEDRGGGISPGSASRVKLYASLDELVADSGAIVHGTVSQRTEEPDGSTLLRIQVERAFTPANLGTTSPEPPVAVRDGAEVVVRTLGGVVSSVPSAPLEPGGEYLLFLTPTGLRGAAAEQFFITGVVAGVYEAQGGGFARVVDDGDTLPAELSPEDLR